jgi:ABC-2 type transport system ATP-binding protein
MTTQQAAILSIKGLTKSYDGKPVLKSLSLDLFPGMVVGLLGLNGAGKTTLMHCALGILAIDGGEVSILGDCATNLSIETKAKVGFVSQQPFGYEGFSVDAALALHRSFYPNWDKSLEQSWLERFGLEAKQQVQRLSVGQRQSLALIMAMAYRPKLLLLDEPVASLDPIARRKFMGDLFDLALESGSAVIFSSHITSDLERVASHLALIKDGELLIFREIDSLREEVKSLVLEEGVTLPPELTVLQRQGNSVLVDNYQGQAIQGLKSVTSLNLEQLFVALHP